MGYASDIKPGRNAISLSRSLLGGMVILSLFAGAQCKQGGDRNTATTVAADDWVYEGWACAPDQDRARDGRAPSQDCSSGAGPEYLYLKVTGKASIKAMTSNSRVQKLESCQGMARAKARDRVSVLPVISSYLKSIQDLDDELATKRARDLVQLQSSMVQTAGIYNCCTAVPGSNNCSAEEGRPTDWQACVCIASFHFRGGEENFNKVLAEIGNE